jgi:hypothetical protein
MPDVRMTVPRSPGLRTSGLPLAAALALLLALQAGFSARHPRDWQAEHSPGPPPGVREATIASLGEPAAAAYALTLTLQTFDTQAGASLGLRTLDQQAVRAWLDRALDLNPASGYPLLLAARVYAEAARPDDARALLELVLRRFDERPDARWPWLAHALYVARHVLRDPELARRYARALRERASGPAVPAWVRQAEMLLLADLDQPEAARVLLGALLDSGQVTDAAERAFLLGRLHALDAREPAPAAPGAHRPGVP